MVGISKQEHHRRKHALRFPHSVELKVVPQLVPLGHGARQQSAVLRTEFLRSAALLQRQIEATHDHQAGADLSLAEEMEQGCISAKDATRLLAVLGKILANRNQNSITL